MPCSRNGGTERPDPRVAQRFASAGIKAPVPDLHRGQSVVATEASAGQ